MEKFSQNFVGVQKLEGGKFLQNFCTKNFYRKIHLKFSWTFFLIYTSKSLQNCGEIFNIFVRKFSQNVCKNLNSCKKFFSNFFLWKIFLLENIFKLLARIFLHFYKKNFFNSRKNFFFNEKFFEMFVGRFFRNFCRKFIKKFLQENVSRIFIRIFVLQVLFKLLLDIFSKFLFELFMKFWLNFLTFLWKIFSKSLLKNFQKDIGDRKKYCLIYFFFRGHRNVVKIFPSSLWQFLIVFSTFKGEQNCYT